MRGYLLRSVPKRSGKPAKKLSDALAAAGQPRSTRQLERAAQAGLIPSQFEGMQEEQVRQVVEAFDVLETTGSFDRATLAIFGAGTASIKRDKLERAYSRWVENSRHWIVSRGPGLARSLARQAAKRRDSAELRNRLRVLRATRFIPVIELLTSFYEDLIRIPDRGSASSPQALGELMEGLGIAAAARERLGNEQPLGGELPLRAIGTMLKALHLESLLATVRTASQEELDAARDDVRAFVDFARVVVSVTSRTHGLRYSMGLTLLAQIEDTVVALAAPPMIYLRKALPTQMLNVRELMDRALPGYRAMNLLLDELPPRYQQAFGGAEQLQALTAAERKDLRVRLNQFESAHPSEYGAIVHFDTDAQLAA